MRTEALIVILAAVGVAGCADSVPDPVSETSNEPVHVDYPAVVTESGSVIEVEVVADDLHRARGLMFRPRLEDDRGMIFIFPEPAVETFWMKNTIIPLDMIWLDDELQVTWIEHDVPPCEADPCPSYGPESADSRYVLELSAGGAARYGIEVGDQLSLRNIDPSIAR